MGIGAFNFPRRFLLPAAFRSLCLFDLNQPLLGSAFFNTWLAYQRRRFPQGLRCFADCFGLRTAVHGYATLKL